MKRNQPVQHQTEPIAANRTVVGRGLIAIVGMAALTPILLFLAFYAYLCAFQLVFPGVTVGGAPLDGLTPSEAEAELNRIWNEDYLIMAVDAMAPDNAWLVHPEEFGLAVDAGETTRAAMAVGRDGNLVNGLEQLVASMLEGMDVAPTVVFDEDRAKDSLLVWKDRLTQAAVDADIRLSDGEVMTLPSQAGVTLDVDATLSLLRSDPQLIMLEYRFIPLLTIPVDPLRENVDTAADAVRRYLGANPLVRAFDPVTGEHLDWSPDPEQVAGWISIDHTGEELEVFIDPDQVEAYLRDHNNALGNERGIEVAAAIAEVMGALETGDAVSLLVRYDPTEYLVRGSDTIISIAFDVGIPYWRIQEANPMIAVQGLPVGETIIIPPRDANLIVPPVENKRIVISIREQRMRTYEDGSLRSEHVVSTGMPNSPTMPGVFQVQIHILNAYGENWDLYMPHFLGIYEAVPGFMNGIHGLPLLSSGVRLWADVLGNPASYGCIILGLDEAEDVYTWAENGVVVEIQP